MESLSPLVETNSNSCGEPKSKTAEGNRSPEPRRGSHPSNFGQPLWGALPPRLKVFGRLWYCPETSVTFRKLPGPFSPIPGPFGMVLGCSGTFQTVLVCSGAIWIGFGLIRVTVNYPNDRESLSVCQTIIRKLFRLILDFPTTILTCSRTTWHISRVIKALP